MYAQQSLTQRLLDHFSTELRRAMFVDNPASLLAPCKIIYPAARPAGRTSRPRTGRSSCRPSCGINNLTGREKTSGVIHEHRPAEFGGKVIKKPLGQGLLSIHYSFCQVGILE